MKKKQHQNIRERERERTRRERDTHKEKEREGRQRQKLSLTDFSGLAISFAIGQSNPLIGAAWGVLFFKEFEGTSKKTKGLLLGMSLFYVGAIASLGVGGSLDSS